jgi:hypothetical protein
LQMSLLLRSCAGWLRGGVFAMLASAWMFEGDYAHLAPFRDVAHLLAKQRDWPRLYDLEALAKAAVPCAAAIYYEVRTEEGTSVGMTDGFVPTICFAL